MLDRSIPTSKALVHSISINEVKDMKSNVLRAPKASLSEKTLNRIWGVNFNNFNKRKLHPLRPLRAFHFNCRFRRKLKL
jgi:hypothetical protein